jgi:hypothetical protein
VERIVASVRKLKDGKKWLEERKAIEKALKEIKGQV